MNFFVFLLTERPKKSPNDILDVEIIKILNSANRRRQQPKTPPPNRRLITPRQITSETEYRPQTIRMKLTKNETNETVSVSTEILVYEAVKSPINSDDKLVRMNTRQTLARDNSLLSQPTSRLTTTAGEGTLASRQRIRGQGDGLIRSIESSGTTDIGMIGKLPPKKGTGASGKIVSNNPFAKALQKIAQHIVETSDKGKVNVVFLLDTSASMRDNIQQVASHLYAMADTYDTNMIEYFMGMVEFSVRHGEKIIRMQPLQADIALLKDQMQRVGMSGDEYALDALLYALDSVRFQIDADKYLILVTDEPAGTAKTEMTQTLRDKVNTDYELADISVNVLGFDEPFQKQLAQRTNGLWQEIPGGTFTRGSLPAHRKSNESLVKVFRRISAEIRRTGTLIFSIDFRIPNIEGFNKAEVDNRVFSSVTHAFFERGFALANSAQFNRVSKNRWKVYDHLSPYYVIGHSSVNSDRRQLVTIDRSVDRSYTVEYQKHRLHIFNASPELTNGEGKADIVLMFDYSRSMSGKSQALSHGIVEFYQEMDLLPIDYHIGLIRFAIATDTIRVVHGAKILTLDSGQHSPLSEGDIEAALTDPFGGDEYLINALVDGLPRFKFRSNSARYVLIMTDEPATGTRSVEKALQVCRDLGVRVFVFGVSTKDNDFQTRLAIETGGLFFTMPNSFRQIYTDR